MFSLAHKKSEAPSRASIDARSHRKATAAENDRTHINASLQRTIGNRALLRLLQETGSSSARSADRRKCPACETAGGSCAECAKRETAAQRALKTSDMKPDIHGERKKPEAGEMQPELGKAEAVQCPEQRVGLTGQLCGAADKDVGPGIWYGAWGVYYYVGATDWYFSENVVFESDDCNLPGTSIKQSRKPKRTEPGSSFIYDAIFNPGLPPARDCKTVTQQTVFAGPTKASAKQCSYSNKQVIEVKVKEGSNPKSGEVITSSYGAAPAKCEWTQAK